MRWTTRFVRRASGNWRRRPSCARSRRRRTAVAPYELPTELRRFWERVDPASIGDGPFPPGTIIRRAWDDEGFQIAYRSLSALLESFAELVAVNPDLDAEAAERAIQLARLDGAGLHPRYGHLREIGRELEVTIEDAAAVATDIRPLD
jgi:hypothetical protein